MAGTFRGCLFKICQRFCGQAKFQPSVPFVYLFVCFFNKIIKPLFYPLQLLSFSHARKQIHACTEYLVPLKPKRERDLNVKREEENV